MSQAAHGHPEPWALPSGLLHRRGRRLWEGKRAPKTTAELLCQPQAVCAFRVTHPRAGGERSGEAAPGLMGAGLESSETLRWSQGPWALQLKSCAHPDPLSACGPVTSPRRLPSPSGIVGSKPLARQVSAQPHYVQAGPCFPPSRPRPGGHRQRTRAHHSHLKTDESPVAPTAG